ncbi:MAG: ABC transporter ATP-binding protein [Lachnospiraceae bacterium]|nr:ABC transporter ATP-binding protein [Lachnospiraceae bacterium]
MHTNIEINHITKKYKNGVTALDDISFTVGSGVFGLLGHNGAGKTTLMKTLVTILPPSAGTIRICGYDTQKQGNEVRTRIGYLPQELAMYPSLSVFDFVNYMAELKGIRNKEAVREVLEQVEMLEYAKRKIRELSGGMKRRVGIAQAIIGYPQILVVDEPTAGLDPEERVRFRGLLSRYAREGRTVLLSTHIVEDVFQLCEELAVLRKGHLFYAGTSAALMKQVKGKVKILHLEDERQLIDLQKKSIVLSTTYDRHGIHARIMDENALFPQATSAMATLEDAYVYCMGGKIHA